MTLLHKNMTPSLLRQKTIDLLFNKCFVRPKKNTEYSITTSYHVDYVIMDYFRMELNIVYIIKNAIFMYI